MQSLKNEVARQNGGPRMSSITKKERPATLAGVRTSETDLALDGSIFSEYAPTPRDLQVTLLARRFALSAPLAVLLAELAYGEARS